jgi:hypothetical protein
MQMETNCVHARNGTHVHHFFIGSVDYSISLVYIAIMCSHISLHIYSISTTTYSIHNLIQLLYFLCPYSILLPSQNKICFTFLVDSYNN